jgi:hypothetical protein
MRSSYEEVEREGSSRLLRRIVVEIFEETLRRSRPQLPSPPKIEDELRVPERFSTEARWRHAQELEMIFHSLKQHDTASESVMLL